MITLRNTVGPQLARLRACWWLAPGRAAVVDTETTDLDGQVVEISAIDAFTGGTLLDGLIRPTESIALGARSVHGITDAMCQDAPTWSTAWPRISSTLRGRVMLAYNAPYDRSVIEAECKRVGVAPPAWRWGCLMRLDALARGSRRWRRLEGGHRALGDTRAARERLVSIAEGGVAGERSQAAHFA